MRKIVFATSNPHKLEELRAICKSKSDIEFVLPPSDFNPDECGKTFEENSRIKAQEAARISGLPALADDSGLCVDALNGAPGIYSARYAETPQKRIDKLLEALQGTQTRTAKFVCAMTLTNENGEVLFQCVGECKGEIATVQSGENGFGYDPIFIVEGKGVTMADLPEDEKNKISHRAKALEQIIAWLNTRCKNAKN